MKGKGSVAPAEGADPMVIRISIDNKDPLTGSAVTDGRDPLRFEGWMELLRMIGELVGTPPDAEGVTRPR